MVDVQQLTATQNAARTARPRGEWADAPAIAATNVAMVNTSGYDLSVDVTAGTVTVIKVDDVIYKAQNANVVAGRIPVPAGSSLKITYSVAPTSVHWYYL